MGESTKYEARLLTICQVGHPVLRQEARTLSKEEIQSDWIQALIASMKKTMKSVPGVGLAAPQVGLPLQIAVIEDRIEYTNHVPQEKSDERQRTSFADPIVIINPTFTVIGETEVEFSEGCLSLDGFEALVPRAHKIRVDYQDETANSQTLEAEGWYARILQHEIDHLRGIMYIDRMATRSFMSSKNKSYWYFHSSSDLSRLLGTNSRAVKEY